MSETALMVRSNLCHNIPTVIETAKTSLTDLATLYLATKVAGQSQVTLDAKHRDLNRFLAFYHQLCGHDRPEEWFVSVTKAFLKHLRGQRFAQASLVRIYVTVRHFARWLDRKFPSLFPLGCPTNGLKPPAEPTADWKGLTRREEFRLLNAAQTLRVRPGPGTKQGLRNHALLAVLLGSGLRISEVLQLDRDQYNGKGFVRVQVKGGQLPDFVPVQRDARAVLDEWLKQRGDAAGPLFPTRNGRRLSRREAAHIIQRIAGQANANRPQQEHIQVSPHVLRHTFLRKLAEEKGVHYAREASGYHSDRYIWRYVKPDRQTLAEAIDDME
jgi:integrase/recombinase XerD